MTQPRLAVRLAEEPSRTGPEGQIGQFKEIRETVDSYLLERAVSKVLREAKSLAADFFETDGPVFQKTIEYPDVERARDHPSCSQRPVRQAPELASSRQPAPIPLTGQLLKFALPQNRPDEYGRVSCCRRTAVDALRICAGKPLDCGYLQCAGPIEIGVIMASNIRHFDRVASGLSCVCWARPSQQENRMQTRLHNPPDEKAVSSCG